MALDTVTRTLRQALSRLESEKARIERQISALRTALSGARDGVTPRVRRRPMSAAARRAVSQRMKAYWATRKGGKGAPRNKARTAKAEAKAGR